MIMFSKGGSHRVRFGLIGALFGFCLLFGVSIPGFSQGGQRGAITGVVKDSTGGTVPGATLTVINQDTGVTERTLITDSMGSFSATLLPVGTYRVEVTLTGFSKAVAPNIKVLVSETTTVNLTLRVGEISETVTVSGAAAPVQLSSPTTGETIQNVGTLPLATRNFLSLLALSAGTNTEMADTTSLGHGEVSIDVNGMRPTNNNYQLEGINSNDLNLGVFDNDPLPNPQAVQEFKTQTSLYDASQGRNGGGNIQVVLKSGTSNFHGNAFEFFRNNLLNANDWFLNRAGQSRPVLRQNQFGFSLGGPMEFAKDFFFFTNYEGTRAASAISSGTTINTNIPVLPADRSAGNLQSVFFPNGLPAGYSQLDPTALALLNLPATKCPGFNDGHFCIPSLPGTPGLNAAGAGENLANLSLASLGTFDENQFTLNLDKILATRHHLSARWFFSDYNSLRPFGTASSLAFAENFPNQNRFLKLGWTYEISENKVNDVRFGFNRFTFSQTPSNPISLADLGATRPNQDQYPGTYRFNIGGAFQIGPGVNDNRGGAFNTFEGADDFSWTIGKHNIRFGGAASRYQLNRFNNFAALGNVTFASTPAGFAGMDTPALTGFQNFLLGRITTTQAQSGIDDVAFRALDAAAYIQDDWKISSRLTLNLGVRWEGLSDSHDRFNRLSNFQGLGDGLGGPIVMIHPQDAPGGIGTPGVSDCTLLDCFSWHNFAPRFGFAWDMFGDHKTALRGGYGIYYDRTSNQSQLQTFGGLPFQQAISAAALSVTPGNPFPTMLPASAFPLPNNQVVPRLTSFDPATGAPIFNSASGGPLSGFFFFPTRDLRPPYSESWNLTLQREIYKGWVAEFGYIGTRGVFLLGPGKPFNPGQICTGSAPCTIPASLASGVTVPAGTPGVLQNSDGSIAITQSTADNINARVPATFLGLANSRGFFQENGGSSIYNSAQFTLSHQFAQSLYFQGAYTYSRSIDNGSGSTFQDELNGFFQYGDLFSNRSNRGLSDFDRTHRLVVSYQYVLPFAKWMGIADHGFGRMANGWSILGITTFQSGTPFVVVDSSALNLEDTDGINGTNFATLAPGATLNSALTSGSVQSRVNNYLNLNAFQVGGVCVNNQNKPVATSDPGCTGFAAIGNVGRNVFRGPFQQNWDLSIVKTTKLTESKNIEFRAEMFNVFNHPAFQSPQAGATTGFDASLGNYGFVDVAGGDSSILATVNRPRIIQFALKLNF